MERRKQGDTAQSAGSRSARNRPARGQPDGADLGRADLRGADLGKAELVEAYLGKTNLGKTNLSGADLRGTYLVEAYLVGANLIGANLRGANLRGANLSRTDLGGVNLGGAKLGGANLSDALMQGTTLAQMDLRTTKGLTTIQHEGRSYIEPFSVQLPQDGSALHFLRGVGVPDEWIDFWRTTMMHPIQYHSCFISYCSKDERLAARLHADLQEKGVRCWFAPEDMKIGDRIHRRIDEAIHLQDKLLLLLSQDAMTSEWVESEVLTALEKEKRQRRDVLFPVQLDESVMEATQPWVKHMRLKRYIGDFTRWREPEAYQSAFERLLRDLKQDR